MAIKRKNFNIVAARDEFISLIDNFIDPSNAGSLRSKVKALIPVWHLLREFGKDVIKSEKKTSAHDRILIYLKKYPLTIINSEELLVVAGIIDYQRRIRELRVQSGWPIMGGKTAKEMFLAGDWPSLEVDVSKIKPNQYILLDTVQDKTAANRWLSINSIRKQKKLSVRDKLIKYFLQNEKREITGEELLYLANGKSEWARRVRELRTEEGWSIKTRNTGRPDLPVGVYILEDSHQAEIHDRKIDDATRKTVLQRDGYSCCVCGWNYTLAQKGDPRHYLELHHLNYHSDKGSNTEENLITVCNVDHDQIHKKNLSKSDVLKWIESERLK